MKRETRCISQFILRNIFRRGLGCRYWQASYKAFACRSDKTIVIFNLSASRLFHGNFIQKYNASSSTMQGGQHFHIYIEDNRCLFFDQINTILKEFYSRLWWICLFTRLCLMILCDKAIWDGVIINLYI